MKNRVLIVDDAPVMRLILRDTLESQGFEVVGEAGDGKKAFEMYKELKPDIVTMDVIMPQVDGLQAVKDIKSFDPKAVIIVISAVDQRKSLMEAIKYGAADYVIKPFEPDRIEAAIRGALE